MDGLTATRTLTRTSTCAVVVLTTFDLDEYVWTAIEAEAAGFLLKDTPPAGLQEAVRVVARGDALLSPSVKRRVLKQLNRSRSWPLTAGSPESDRRPDRRGRPSRRASGLDGLPYMRPSAGVGRGISARPQRPMDEGARAGTWITGVGRIVR